MAQWRMAPETMTARLIMKRIARAAGVILALAVLFGSVGLLLLSGDNYNGKPADNAGIDKPMEIRTMKGKTRGNG